MKKFILPFLLSGILIASSVIILSSCTKEGAPGPAGVDGQNGADGDNGSATCGQCHDLSSDLIAKIGQYEQSVHANGSTNDRNSTSCAPCHTSQGFVECVANSTDNTAATINNPAKINCRTCHPIHSTYTSADYSLRVSGPVTLRVDASTFDFGKGNTCAKCHQGRAITYPMDSTVFHLSANTAMRFGFHHSPVANLFAGTGGIEIAGTESYDDANYHASVSNTCITCHMSSAIGYVSGGHQLSMTYDADGVETDNTKGCLGCHAGLTTFDRDNVQTDIQALLDALETKLVNIGIMDTNYYGQAGTWTYNQLGALVNFNMCREDKSLGVHNPTYIHALLKNSYDALP
jgi:hypothetical protein